MTLQSKYTEIGIMSILKLREKSMWMKIMEREFQIKNNEN